MKKMPAENPFPLAVAALFGYNGIITNISRKVGAK
jgi:hypothetical protein